MKKAQAQIIVTVLIILIVIAILGFVGTWIYDMVKDSTTSGGDKAECTQVRLEITEALTTGVTVERGSGGPDTIGVILLIDGAQKDSQEFTQLQTQTLTTGQPYGKDLNAQVAANISGTLCEFADETTIVTA
jgi:ribosomal protein S28E/S33